MKLLFLKSNARGRRVGTSHHFCKHSDELVSHVREMRQAGASYSQIRDELGVATSTAQAWVVGNRRKPPARVIVRRVKKAA